MRWTLKGAPWVPFGVESVPQRFLRPGIRTSVRWNSASRNAQALYVALLTLVDDYGRYDGRPSVLCGDAFSVWNELNPDSAINPQEVAALSCDLMRIGLADFYEVDGKKYVQLVQWQERVRQGAKEKYPPNPNPQESAGIRSVPLPPKSSPSPSPSPSSGRLRVQFVRPSLEEVKLQAAKAGLLENESVRFFAYYESNGWKVGKNPMKSWHAAMTNWKGNWEARRNGPTRVENQI